MDKTAIFYTWHSEAPCRTAQRNAQGPAGRILEGGESLWKEGSGESVQHAVRTGWPAYSIAPRIPPGQVEGIFELEWMEFGELLI